MGIAYIELYLTFLTLQNITALLCSGAPLCVKLSVCLSVRLSVGMPVTTFGQRFRRPTENAFIKTKQKKRNVLIYL